MNKKILLFLFLILSCIVSDSSASDVAKIGIVNYQEILKRSIAGKKVAEKLNDIQKKRTDELTKIKNNIVILKKELEKLSLQDNVTLRKEKQVELSINLKKFSDTEQSYTSKLQNANSKYSDMIKKELGGIIKKIGQKGGYLMIMEQDDVLYSPLSTDITDLVIEKYDRIYKSKK